MDDPNPSVSDRGTDSSNVPSANLPLTSAAKSRSGIVPIFLREDGELRSGWSLLLYLFMCIALGYLLNLAGHLRHGRKLPQLWGSFIGEAAAVVIVLIPALIMARIEKRPFGNYGFPQRGAFGKLFWLGAIWGIVGLTVLMLLMRITGAYYFGSLALHGARMWKFAIFWAVLFVLVGLFEEFLLRGYTQFTLGRGIGFWPTAILLSCAFGAIHLKNSGESPAGALGAAVIGLFFCLTLRRTGNLWFAVGLHASWDWGETFLYSVANSGLQAPGHLLNPSFQGPTWLTGGTVGPEASVFVFVVMALMWLLFHRMYPGAKRVEAGLTPPSTPVAYQE